MSPNSVDTLIVLATIPESEALFFFFLCHLFACINCELYMLTFPHSSLGESESRELE